MASSFNEQLCPRCGRINFDELRALTPFEENGKLLRNLGIASGLSTSPSCSLCCLLTSLCPKKSAISNRTGLRGMKNAGEIFQLKGFRTLGHKDHHHETKRSVKVCAVISFEPLASSETWRVRLIESKFRVLLLPVSQAGSQHLREVDSLLFGGAIVKEKHINYPEISKWLRDCPT
jgi:hypothetical protein